MSSPKAMSDGLKISALTIGVVAARTLLASGPAQVLASFAPVFYLSTQSGLICVTSAAVENGPISVRTNATCDWRAVGIRVGQTASITPHLLRIGPLIDIDMAGACCWTPTRGPCPISLARTARGLRCLRTLLTRQSGIDGLRGLLTPDITPQPHDVLIQRAVPLIQQAQQWASDAVSGQVQPKADWAVSLLGAGPGLTPSGDDVLGGAMIALHAAGHSDAATALWAQIAPHLQTRTNQISAAFLQAASKGHGGAAMHQMVEALLAGEPDAIDRALAGIAQIGHSSGWDALLGVVTVFDALAAQQTSRAA